MKTARPPSPAGARLLAFCTRGSRRRRRKIRGGRTGCGRRSTGGILKLSSPSSGHRLSGGARRSSILTLGLTLALAAATLALAGAAPAQRAAAATVRTDYKTTIKDGRKVVKEHLKGAPGASLSLQFVKNGKVVWQQGFGDADRSTQAAPAPETMYGIASVSKIVATVAAIKSSTPARSTWTRRSRGTSRPSRWSPPPTRRSPSACCSTTPPASRAATTATTTPRSTTPATWRRCRPPWRRTA